MPSDSPESPVDWTYQTPSAAPRRLDPRTPAPGSLSPHVPPRGARPPAAKAESPHDDDPWLHLGRGVATLGVGTLAVASVLAAVAAGIAAFLP